MRFGSSLSIRHFERLAPVGAEAEAGVGARFLRHLELIGPVAREAVLGRERLVDALGLGVDGGAEMDGRHARSVQSVTIQGELVAFLFRNPHSFVHIMVKEKDGSMVRYAVEWGGAGQLGGQGVTRETLKPGDHVIISGSPGRNPADHRVRMVTLHRPKDGFGWGKKPGEVVD